MNRPSIELNPQKLDIVTLPIRRAGGCRVAGHPGLNARCRPHCAHHGQPLRRPSAVLPAGAINARSKVHTPLSTLASWSGRGGAALVPLFDAHKSFVLSSQVLHVDETPVSMLDPGADKTKRAYVWAYARGAFNAVPGVVYDFCVGRGAQYPVAFLLKNLPVAGERALIHRSMRPLKWQQDDRNKDGILMNIEKPTGRTKVLLCAMCFGRRERVEVL